ncbi:DUF5000 domain-containing lipoprotein [Sphingobacterium sp. UT-1RO-CII-1]|uniref:DUF5000 domain-containing lipoprotein n=1 Tax=Sphingobacterium sp. UT-1RO-CII-1 TaxID=2995225 RepID=UPI00227A37FB|nr:DUF5000 domain-containing lipoprotein [Sphingobacterium sp. UT-1RO-CII-1]MCY4779231.1 DUF5000 domain-containing lipoprotein [Sphingobacterium sp. UT-1RO-CII-1]
MMKKNRFYIILILLLDVFMYSCNEERIGQFPIESTAPQELIDPFVENLKGGATIHYTLPGDADLLYVKATYTLPSGEVKIQKTSAFSSSITIKGFSRSGKSIVELRCVDRSQNESEPIFVEIEPKDSPIFDIYNSFSVEPAFGGIKVSWENTESEEVLIDVLKKDNENNWSSIEKLYTSITKGIGFVRNQEAVESSFGVYVRDTYGNRTDTLYVTEVPFEEQILDKALWKEMRLCPGIEMNIWGAKSMNVLWNGITNEGTAYYLNDSQNGLNSFFTIDLGVKAQLSRFKFWGRSGWYFNLHHPKEFEIWGTNDPIVANSDPCSWNGWTLLTTGVSEKPSGPDPLAADKLSTEDKALAALGEEFEFSEEAPPVRYIRFKKVKTWTNSPNVFLAELSFWGKPLNENQ